MHATVALDAEPRRTAKARELLQALRAASTFVSAQDLYAAMHTSGSRIGLATIYRHLQAFTADGTVDMIRGGDGEARYRVCDDIAPGTHHHHLVCASCGRVVEISAAAVERWARRIAVEQGFVDVDHTIEVFGTCRRCSRQADQRQTS